MTSKFFKVLIEILLAIAVIIAILFVVINFIAFNDKSIEISLKYLKGDGIESIDALVMLFTSILDLSFIGFVAKIMGKIVLKNQPCLDKVDCCSSDARQVYEDGTSFCFSCKRFFTAKEGEVDSTEMGFKMSTPSVSNLKPPTLNRQNNQVTVADIDSYISKGFKERDITRIVAEFFGVKVSFDSNGDGGSGKQFFLQP
jgi:hypothetical protein